MSLKLPNTIIKVESANFPRTNSNTGRPESCCVLFVDSVVHGLVLGRSNDCEALRVYGLQAVFENLGDVAVEIVINWIRKLSKSLILLALGSRPGLFCSVHLFACERKSVATNFRFCVLPRSGTHCVFECSCCGHPIFYLLSASGSLLAWTHMSTCSSVLCDTATTITPTPSASCSSGSATCTCTITGTSKRGNSYLSLSFS